MLGEGQSDVGFLAENGGSMSGFFEEPDIDFANRINGLRGKCRECQVFLAGETCGEIEKKANLDSGLLNPLIILDLNDVRD